MKNNYEFCIFCQIAQGEIDSYIVYENDVLKAFLDCRPIRPGHVQIIPKEHFEYFDDLPTSIANEIFELAQRIGKAQKKLYNVDRVGFLFTGGDVKHAHAHVVPLVGKNDITSREYIKEKELTFVARPRARAQDLEEVSLKLSFTMKEFSSD